MLAAEVFMACFSQVREFFRRFCRSRSIRVTPEGAWFILLATGVGAAAINTGNNLLYLLFAMMLSLIVASGFLSERCLKQLDVRRRIPERVFANRPTTAIFCITNRHATFPAFSLRIMDIAEGAASERGVRVLHLPPKASTRRSYPLLLSKRGRHRLGGVKLQTKFPFGFFIKGTTLPLDSDVIVYPEVKPLPDRLVHDLTAMGQQRSIPRRGRGAALYNLRSYQPGDDSRTIHWKTTARQNLLIVQETEAEDQRRVTVALPTALRAPHTGTRSSCERDFEEAVSLGASLVNFLKGRAYAVRLLVGDQEVPHGTGEKHFHQILEVLALCRLTLKQDPGSTPDSFLKLGSNDWSGDLTILILPWEDPSVRAACRGAHRILLASDFL